MLGLCGIPTTPVGLLKKKWQRFSAIHDSSAKYFQICHSGGAIHVYNALASSPKAVRDRIIVLAIAPVTIIPRHLCRASYNFASKRDSVPKYDIIGRRRYGNQLTLLDPHPEALEDDHGFDSPTVQTIIQKRINDYLKQVGE